MKIIILAVFALNLLFVNLADCAETVKERSEVSQYGIIWKFDKPVKSGQFITGDWWIIGPATIVSITPAPGPAPVVDIKKDQWGNTSLSNDTRMCNGSMIVVKCDGNQGYDSRSAGYDESSSVKLPCTLEVNRTIISTISNRTLPVDNFVKNLMWSSEKKEQTLLKAAAVLTCLSEAPPEGAFRPPFAGAEKPIFLSKNLKWDILPKLKSVGPVPSWEEFERYFQRPWLDHIPSWTQRGLSPNENQPAYGREHGRVVSLASLMVILDVPQSRKEKLVIGMVQLGIDLYGQAKNGGNWNQGGGHGSGRKWPILFASLMLNEPKLVEELPKEPTFHEDAQTYYGTGWFGQKVMWQMVTHHGPRKTYEEKPPEKWEEWDTTSEGYRCCCNALAWVGTALTARYMKAIKLWAHDAFFDYVDRWMREDDPYAKNRGKHKRPEYETTTFDDPFVSGMWKAYRKSAPSQEMSGKNFKFIWKGSKMAWENNPRPLGVDK